VEKKSKQTKGKHNNYFGLHYMAREYNTYVPFLLSHISQPSRSHPYMLYIPFIVCVASVQFEFSLVSPDFSVEIVYIMVYVRRLRVSQKVFLNAWEKEKKVSTDCAILIPT
jgi:hypothetical protein